MILQKSFLGSFDTAAHAQEKYWKHMHGHVRASIAGDGRPAGPGQRRPPRRPGDSSSSSETRRPRRRRHETAGDRLAWIDGTRRIFSHVRHLRVGPRTSPRSPRGSQSEEGDLRLERQAVVLFYF